MTKETIHIVLSSDDRFRIGLLATVRSIGLHLSSAHRLDVNILNCGLSDPDEVAKVLKRHAATDATIRIRDVPLERLDRLSINRVRLSKAAFARLLAPSLLPELDRVIYLDSDLLVTTDISKLWEIDLHGAPLGAVPDPHYVFLGEDISNCREMGINPFRRYFGSGVLLVDLAKWRNEQTERSLMELGEPGRLVRKFNDQSILNAHFAGRVRYLPRRWNQLRFHWNNSGAFAPRQPGIVHVGGSPKPWHFPEKGATGVNRLYQSVMNGVFVPEDWMPEINAQHPHPGPKAFLQTLKLDIRSSRLGYFRSLPFVWRSLRKRRMPAALPEQRAAKS